MEEKNYGSLISMILVTLILLVISLSVILSLKIFKSVSVDENSYVMRELVNNDDVLPVINEVEEKYNLPYVDEKTSILIDYYNYNDTEDIQEKSLILYERTYMPSTGIIYTNESEFSVISSFSGKVTKIETDDVLGNIVEISNNNVTARYSSISNVNVKLNDEVKALDVIGTSGTNKLLENNKNVLLFEIIIDGNNVDPQDYYGKELQ